MKRSRAYVIPLLVAVLVTGFALGTPRPARANDTGAFLAGAVLGFLVDNAFDRDYPRGFTYGDRGGYGYGAGYGHIGGTPVWFSWPASGVFALPRQAQPYPYGHRWWEFAGTFRGRPVFLPAVREPFGYRQVAPFPRQPIFVHPQYAARWHGSNWGVYGRFGNRWDVFGRYGWVPAPRLRTYRVPSGGFWYNGPDPDDWYEGREHGWRPRPDTKREGRPGQTWRQPPENWRKGIEPPLWQGRPGQGWQGQPGQPGREHPGPGWKDDSDRPNPPSPPPSRKVGPDDDDKGRRPQGVGPGKQPKGKRGEAPGQPRHRGAEKDQED
jgi:hypothetical protein